MTKKLNVDGKVKAAQGDPDLYSECSNTFGVPLNWSGAQLAWEGSTYAGLVLTSDMPDECVSREYLQFPLGIDSVVDDQGNHLHVSRLVGLRHWAEGIDLGEDRLTFTVLENSDPAAAIIDYARHNHVDHILMGARGHSSTRRYLGSVSSQVVAEAHCNVTVMRLRETPEVAAHPEPEAQAAPG